jgi:hypothetical protein
MACPWSHDYGCLTQIKSGIYKSQSEEMTVKIMADDRIPIDFKKITIKSLPVFAEYQRQFDVLFKRN